MAEQSAPAGSVLSFGRFALSPHARLLTRDGVPVELGGRTLDTLIALATRPNQIMSKRDLMAQVWPDVTVEEGSLRFHIAVLRKILGDGMDGDRFITTLAGRGYCFVAKITSSRTTDGRTTGADATWDGNSNLPARLEHIVGREDSVRMIVAELAVSRFVTIAGPGGVGKTTVAVAVAHELLSTFDGAVLFVDFSLVSDPRMVPVSVASMLGLSVQSDDPVPSLIARLRERRMLVVLDNCEHVIDDAASMAARLLQAAPDLVILTTSREPLRAQGERVHRLAPLALPPEHSTLTAQAVLDFPAARLFVERATASGARLEPGHANAALVAAICRKLDGMALAIELAAGRVEAYGLQQTAALLDERFALLWPGQRTAPARQKTLQATFDWSYRLLSDTERAVFRGLAVFVGPFRIDAALAVVTSETVDAPRMFAAIDSLVAKSLVAAVPAGATMRYRLLDAARAYALEITTDRAERRALAASHVAHCLRWLEGFATNPPGLLDATRRLSNLVELNNVRAALTWCFGDDGDVTSGIELVTAAAPVFFAMSLLTECQHWSQRAIAALDDATLGGRREMRLQAALALSLMWTRGNSEATLAALNRSIAIARMRDDPLNQIMLLAPLHVFHMRTAEFRTAMHYARDVCALSRTTEDRSSIELSRILLGYSCHFAGDLAAARSELEAALRHSPAEARRLDRQTPATMMDDAMAAPILALAWAAAPSALARTLWLQGQPAAALEQVHRTLADTADANHPVAMVVAVMYAISVLIWNGDFDAAADQIAGFVAVAKSSDLPSHILLGRCFEAQLAISRGETQRGVDLLQISLRDLRALRYEILTTSFNLALVEAFVALGRLDEAQGLIETAIESTRTNGDLCYLPELLRVKALVLDALPQPQDDAAEACLEQALVLSRDQGALAWELRGTIDRARRLAMQGQTDLARTSLASVVDCFAAESDTADLRTARDLLATLARKLLRNSPKGDFVPPTTPPP